MNLKQVIGCDREDCAQCAADREAVAVALAKAEQERLDRERAERIRKRLRTVWP